MFWCKNRQTSKKINKLDSKSKNNKMKFNKLISHLWKWRWAISSLVVATINQFQIHLWTQRRMIVQHEHKYSLDCFPDIKILSKRCPLWKVIWFQLFFMIKHLYNFDLGHCRFFCLLFFIRILNFLLPHSYHSQHLDT